MLFLILERCASDTCQNGGTCLSLIEGTSCQCPGGFAGQRCETGKRRMCRSFVVVINAIATTKT